MIDNNEPSMQEQQLYQIDRNTIIHFSNKSEKGVVRSFIHLCPDRILEAAHLSDLYMDRKGFK